MHGTLVDEVLERNDLDAQRLLGIVHDVVNHTSQRTPYMRPTVVHARPVPKYLARHQGGSFIAHLGTGVLRGTPLPQAGPAADSRSLRERLVPHVRASLAQRLAKTGRSETFRPLSAGALRLDSAYPLPHDPLPPPHPSRRRRTGEQSSGHGRASGDRG